MFSHNICLFNKCLHMLWSSRLDSILPYLSMAVNAVSLLRVSDSGLSPSRLMEASHLVNYNQEKPGVLQWWLYVLLGEVCWSSQMFSRQFSKILGTLCSCRKNLHISDLLVKCWNLSDLGGRSGQLEVGRVVWQAFELSCTNMRPNWPYHAGKRKWRDVV
jgi:hypothetical protein